MWSSLAHHKLSVENPLGNWERHHFRLYSTEIKRGAGRIGRGGSMKVDLLAIAPHPDDVELTCGGTMLKMAEAGYRTGILDLTRGETGTRGTPETRLREAARAGKILGAKIRRNLELPDAHLRVCYEQKEANAAVIRQLEP